MKQKQWFLLLPVIFFVAAVVLFMTESTEGLPDTDMSAVNRIVRETAQNWEQKAFEKEAEAPYHFAVVSEMGELLFRSSPDMPENIYDGVKQHMTVLNVEQGGTILGQVLIDTGYSRNFHHALKGYRQLFLIMLLVLLLIATACGLYLNQRIMKPFQRLQGFARHVAMGNLDMPLSMDKKHSFGAFTESFDLMREQIKEAKRREEKESKSKRELTASLSHDIKTPVTSIKLMSELLLVTESEENTKNKIRSIYQKADQIDHLISNLLQSSLEDLGELTVSVADESSRILEDLIEAADYCGSIHSEEIPGCMIRTDRQRLCQVFDNVIYNSYKYAGTPITIQFRLTDRELILICKDKGSGVPEEELPYLFQKYYRGSNSRASKADGSGLGLYIAHYLMDQMGGGIQCYNWEEGFCTELILPLSMPETAPISCSPVNRIEKD